MRLRVLFLLGVALLAACGGSDEATVPAEPTASADTAASAETTASEETTRLVDLRGVDDLRARVNADVGAPRLVLLLSPT